MPVDLHKFVFNTYSPSSRKFRRVVGENSTLQHRDAPEPELESETESENGSDSQFSEWNGFSDEENNVSQPLTTTFCREPSSCQSNDTVDEDDAVSSHQSSSDQFLDAFEYQPDDDDCSAYLSDSFELPPLSDPHFFDNDSDENDDNEEATAIPRKRGRKVNSAFPFPPQGELRHPFLDWTIDEAAMNSYMPAYAKQEGCAMNLLKERGGVRRW